MDDKVLALLNDIHSTVRKHFVEVSEAEEHWSMPPPDYDGTQLVKDDCDGFCLACRVLLRESSIANRLVYCEVDKVGHLVVEVDGWILDNRQKVVVPNALLREYHWRAISGYQARDPWHEIVSLS